ncbi:MAG TPA: GNAT family N-acetyltransferase [Streptosporangiaceae bacterium]|nr:GNAT family N-acetyltransferase [Streptosporangiaceae bacterium]
MSEAPGAVEIRPARPDDVDRIYELIIELAIYERSADKVESTAEDLRAALCAPEPALFGHVAEAGGQIIGYALWFVNYSTWSGKHGIYLEDLYVRPEMRGAGTGKALLATLASICVQRGYRRLEWWVLDWNTPAIGFYESLGAVAMSDWTVHRLTGAPLADLASTVAS